MARQIRLREAADVWEYLDGSSLLDICVYTEKSEGHVFLARVPQVSCISMTAEDSLLARHGNKLRDYRSSYRN